MLKSTLLELLGSLSPKELKEFGDYIRSPFFNKNDNIVRLYDHIKKSLSDPKKLQKEYAFSKIFKGENYNDSAMRSLMFNLAKLAEDYLAHVNFVSGGRSTLHLLRELNKRNLNKSFEKKLKAALEDIDKTEFKDSEFFYQKYLLIGERDTYNFKNARMLNIKDKPDESVLEQSENLIIFFLISIMRRYRYLLNRKYTVSVDFNLKSLEEMINHLHNNSYGNIPMLTFYYNTLNLLLYEREEDFYKLRGYLQEYSSYLAESEIYSSCVILQNYCIKKFHEGNLNYLKEMFITEKFTLAKGIYKMEGTDYMAPVHYNNIVVTALKLKEYEWTENFINGYKNKLAPDQRDNAYNYSYSRLHFERGDYRKALDMLSLVQNEDIYYKMAIKQFLLKIYYELGMYQEILDVSDTFRHFLSNNKLLTKMHVETNSNFMKLLNRLVKVKDDGDRTDAGFLKEEIMKTENLVGRDWLAEKAGELEKDALTVNHYRG